MSGWKIYLHITFIWSFRKLRKIKHFIWFSWLSVCWLEFFSSVVHCWGAGEGKLRGFFYSYSFLHNVLLFKMIEQLWFRLPKNILEKINDYWITLPFNHQRLLICYDLELKSLWNTLNILRTELTSGPLSVQIIPLVTNTPATDTDLLEVSYILSTVTFIYYATQHFLTFSQFPVLLSYFFCMILQVNNFESWKTYYFSCFSRFNLRLLGYFLKIKK